MLRLSVFIFTLIAILWVTPIAQSAPSAQKRCPVYSGTQIIYWVPCADPTSAPPQNTGGNPPPPPPSSTLPTDDLPRYESHRLILQDPTKKIWLTGAMTYERALAERDALGTWYEENFLTADSKKLSQATTDLQDLNGHLQWLANLAASQSQPQATAVPTVIPQATEVPNGSVPSPEQCAEWKRQFIDALSKLRSIDAEITQLEQRLPAARAKQSQAYSDYLEASQRTAAIQDKIELLEIELAGLKEQFRDENDRETRSQLLNQIRNKEAELKKARSDLVEASNRETMLHNAWIVAKRVLGTLESDLNAKKAAARYWVGVAEKLQADLNRCK